MKGFLAMAALGAALAFAANPVHASWAPTGNVVTQAPGDQWGATAIPWRDGVLIAWADPRYSPLDLFYAQFLTSTGARPAGWAPDGNAIGVAAGGQVALAAGSAAGAYAAWTDNPGSAPALFLLRITPDGAPAAGWPAGGLRIADEFQPGGRPPVTPVGDDVYVAWTADDQVRVGRITPSGAPAAGWPSDGVALGPGAANSERLALATDDEGGLFAARVVWNEPQHTIRIHLHRITASGAVHAGWLADGLDVSPAQTAAYLPRLVPDGTGGVFVVWNEMVACPIASCSLIRATRVSGSASPDPRWAASVDFPSADLVAPDGSGGLFAITSWGGWFQYSDATGNVRRVDEDARTHPGWGSGVSVSIEGGATNESALLADGAGGAYVAWIDWRSGEATLDLTRLDGSGAIATGWPRLGSLAAPGVAYPQVPLLVASGTGRPILIWTDMRAGSRDLYAKEAVPGPPAPPALLAVKYGGTHAFGVRRVLPNPAEGRFWVTLSLPDVAPATVDLVDITGRVIETRRVDLGGPAEGALIFNAAARMKPGVYWVRVRQVGRTAASRVVIAR